MRASTLSLAVSVMFSIAASGCASTDNMSATDRFLLSSATGAILAGMTAPAHHPHDNTQHEYVDQHGNIQHGRVYKDRDGNYHHE